MIARTDQIHKCASICVHCLAHKIINSEVQGEQCFLLRAMHGRPFQPEPNTNAKKKKKQTCIQPKRTLLAWRQVLVIAAALKGALNPMNGYKFALAKTWECFTLWNHCWYSWRQTNIEIQPSSISSNARLQQFNNRCVFLIESHRFIKMMFISSNVQKKKKKVDDKVRFSIAVGETLSADLCSRLYLFYGRIGTS